MNTPNKHHNRGQHQPDWFFALGGGLIVWLLSCVMLGIAARLFLAEITDPAPPTPNVDAPPNPAATYVGIAVWSISLVLAVGYARRELRK